MMKPRHALWVVVVLLCTPVAAGQEGVEPARFHHLHLNVTDAEQAIDFYKRFFSAVPMKFRGAAEALLVDRSFILLTEVEAPPPADLQSAIWHIGWGGVDGPSEYEWRKNEGVEFATPLTGLGRNYYMYAYGPSRELIEIWTGFHHNRFGHVHLFAEDVNETTDWYVQHLGLTASRGHTPKPPPPEDPNVEFGPGDVRVLRYIWANSVRSQGVTLNIFGKPEPPWWRGATIDEFAPTKGRAVDHIAFGYPEIGSVLDRMRSAGLEIVEPITWREEHKMKSFFVQGPGKVLIEIVEARPIPEGVWE